MATGLRKYKWKKIDENQIRLLTILPGPRNTELEGSFQVIDFFEKGPESSRYKYEALSYFWGDKADEPNDFYIKILDQGRSYRCPIRPNLMQALKRLRLEEDDRVLWVDALCLHQKDNEEKDSQIPRMHIIYNRAQRVCVWLGVEDKNSANGMKFVERLSDLKTLHTIQNIAEAQNWADFATLLRRPWFNRRWIIQELAVARAASIYCGQAKVEWKQFQDAIAIFSSDHVDLRNVFKASPRFNHNPNYLGNLKQLGAYKLVTVSSDWLRKSDRGDILENRRSLEDIVSELTAFDASDPRDTIYAVLSLSSDARAQSRDKADFAIDEALVDKVLMDGSARASQPPSPTASHSPRAGRRPSVTDGQQLPKSRTAFRNSVRAFLRPFVDEAITVRYRQEVFEVYKAFLQHVITNSKSLDIICRPWAVDDPDPILNKKMPSWIPRKRGGSFVLWQDRAYSRVRADPLVSIRRNHGKLYSACGKQRVAVWRYVDQPKDGLGRSLVVEGVVLDRVGRMYDTARGGIIPAEWKDVRASEKMSDSFWKTLVADCGLDGHRTPPSYYRQACEIAFDEHAASLGYLDTKELITETSPTVLKEFLEQVQSVTWMRRLITTRNYKLMGLVPHETGAEDSICILHGCSVPVVLRKHDTLPVPHITFTASASARASNTTAQPVPVDEDSTLLSPGRHQRSVSLDSDMSSVAEEEMNAEKASDYEGHIGDSSTQSLADQTSTNAKSPPEVHHLVTEPHHLSQTHSHSSGQTSSQITHLPHNDTLNGEDSLADFRGARRVAQDAAVNGVATEDYPGTSKE